MNRALEALIRECPDQYLWSYNRYKRPSGAKREPRMSRLVFAFMWLVHFLPLARARGARQRASAGSPFWLIAERRTSRASTWRNASRRCRRASASARARALPRLLPQLRRARHPVVVARASASARLVRLEGLEHLRALDGRPVILFAPHFVGLDAALARLVAASTRWR